jgi:hypothetical protein
VQKTTERFWSIYFKAYLTLFIIFTLLTIYFQEFPLVYTIVLDVIALYGFYKFVTTKTVSYSFFWIIIASLFTARIIRLWYNLLPNIYPWLSLSEQKVSLWILASSLPQLPVVLALWLYSFQKSQNA